MPITTSRQLYEVNLYCELTYPEHETTQERFEVGLCDYNLVFLTELDESASVTDLLKELTSRFPEKMDEFFLEVVEEHTDASCNYCGEYHYPQDEGILQPDEDELFVMENHCPYQEVM
jgi:hypothetical protein